MKAIYWLSENCIKLFATYLFGKAVYLLFGAEPVQACLHFMFSLYLWAGDDIRVSHYSLLQRIEALEKSKKETKDEQT